MTANAGSHATPQGSVTEVFLAFLKLGCSAFGGPVAHIGYFRTEFVERRRWLDDQAFADLVALCQFLPGPASSQVGLGLGARRGGTAGAVAAWIGFTLPSAALMVLAAYGIAFLDALGAAGGAAIHGLKLVAVAVVAQAVRQMAVALAPDRERATILVVAAAVALNLPGVAGQLGAIFVGVVAGLLVCRQPAGDVDGHTTPLVMRVPVPVAILCLVTVGVLLLLPAVVAMPDVLRVAEAAFRAGSLVFGGGHVVLPLLKADIVDTGLVDADTFLAGYGLAQAVPGPLFTFGAFLGTVSILPPGGVPGAALALLAIFLPSGLLLFGALPFWDRLRAWAPARAAITGVNAAVVGLLAAALYDPVATAAIHAPRDVAAVLAAYLLLEVWKAPPWSVVLGFGVAAGLIAGVAG